MANAARLNSWLLERAVTLDLRVENLTWVSRFFPHLSEITTQISLAGATFQGWAFGATQELALTKSIAEALERTVMQEQRFPTSNGMAAHFIPEKAAKAAISELVERDIFLCHFLTRTPFQPSTDDLSAVEPLVSWLEANGAVVKFYKLSELGRVCVIDGRNARQTFGFVIGSALKESLHDSIFSSLMEAGRKAQFFLSDSSSIQDLTLDEFVKLPTPGFSDHGKLALNVDFANTIAFLFEATATLPTTEPSADWKDRFEVKLYQPLHAQLSGCPLHFARATSTQVQDMFLGAPTPEKINLERLSEFSQRDLRWQDINPLPHPFD